MQLSRHDLSQLDEGYLAKLPEQQLPIEQTHHHHPETCAGCGAALSIAEGGRARAEPGHGRGDPAWTVALSERLLAGPVLAALICAL